MFFMGIRFALCCVGAEDSYPNETKRVELSVQLGLTYRRRGALWPPPPDGSWPWVIFFSFFLSYFSEIGMAVAVLDLYLVNYSLDDLWIYKYFVSIDLISCERFFERYC